MNQTSHNNRSAPDPELASFALLILYKSGQMFIFRELEPNFQVSASISYGFSSLKCRRCSTSCLLSVAGDFRRRKLALFPPRIFYWRESNLRQIVTEE